MRVWHRQSLAGQQGIEDESIGQGDSPFGRRSRVVESRHRVKEKKLHTNFSTYIYIPHYLIDSISQVMRVTLTKYFALLKSNEPWGVGRCRDQVS